MNDFYFFEDFIIRCPIRPFGLYADYCVNPIAAILDDMQLGQAILLGSTSLYQNIQKHECLSQKKQVRCINSSTRYLARLSSRCTPFGLFSGVGLTKKGEYSSITIEDFDISPYVETKYLLHITQYLISQDAIKKSSNYSLNPTLYRFTNECKLVKTVIDNGDVSYRYLSIKRTELIDHLLDSKLINVSWENLVNIVCDLGYSRKDAEEYIDDIIENQFVISDLFLNITGVPYLDRVLDFLREHNLSTYLVQLEKVKSEIDDISQGIFNAHTLASIKESLDSFIGLSETYTSTTCVDLGITFSSDSTIGHQVLREIKRLIKFLNRIRESSKNTHLERFKELFLEIYGDNEVPLSLVLDPEVGIGYPVFQNTLYSETNFLEGFDIHQNTSSHTFNRLEEKLLEKISIYPLCNEIELFDDIFSDEDLISSELPLSIFVLFEIISDGVKGAKIRLISAGDNSSCNLLSRFSGSNTDIEKLCKEILIHRKRILLSRSQIIAQIVHLPKSRAGNVIRHPHLTEYEIPIGILSTLPDKRVIKYNDLFVSVKNNRIVIRSSVLGKEIIPSLNNAYDYSSSSMPIYRFLCDLQSQDFQSSLFFNIENLRSTLRYIPRIRYQNTILSPATWRISSEEFSELLVDLADEKLLSITSFVFQKLNLPSEVYIEEGDNRLYINIEYSNSIRSFLVFIKGKQDIVFTEVLYDENMAIIRDHLRRGYTNECVAFLYRNNE